MVGRPLNLKAFVIPWCHPPIARSSNPGIAFAAVAVSSVASCAVSCALAWAFALEFRGAMAAFRSGRTKKQSAT